MFQDDPALFWQWWEKVSAYIPGTHCIDFCIICDQDSPCIFPDVYPMTEVSNWKNARISQFLETTRQGHVTEIRRGEDAFILRTAEGAELRAHFFPMPRAFKAASQSSISINNYEKDIVRQESELAKHYRKQTENYKRGSY